MSFARRCTIYLFSDGWKRLREMKLMSPQLLEGITCFNGPSPINNQNNVFLFSEVRITASMGTNLHRDQEGPDLRPKANLGGSRRQNGDHQSFYKKIYPSASCCTLWDAILASYLSFWQQYARGFWVLYWTCHISCGIIKCRGGIFSISVNALNLHFTQIWHSLLSCRLQEWRCASESVCLLSFHHLEFRETTKKLVKFREGEGEGVVVRESYMKSWILMDQSDIWIPKYTEGGPAEIFLKNTIFYAFPNVSVMSCL